MNGWVNTVIAIATLGTALVALAAYALSRRKNAEVTSDARMRAIAREEGRPLADRQQELAAAAERHRQHADRVEALLSSLDAKVDSLAGEMAGVQAKVGLYWQTVAMEAAKMMHQPDPARQHVDRLLEAFMEGTLTPEERTELKKVLVRIRNFEPSGPPMEFEVHPGEQVAAAILLSTMDYVNSDAMASAGHYSHRSASHKPARRPGDRNA